MLKEPKIKKSILKSHSRFIKELDVCVAKGLHDIQCAGEIQSCHIRSGFFCMARKPAKREVPMCYAHHDYQHSAKIGEKRFWGRRLKDAIRLAEGLWEFTGDRTAANMLIGAFID